MRDLVSRYQSSTTQLRKNPSLPTPKARNLSPDLLQELDNLDKGADSRKSALKALKSHLKDLDSRAIPLFLARVSETKEPGASFGEHTISLYEVLARVHGPNIIPQIDSIMASIVRTLQSSAGSLPLHQACSKVAPAIARYAIDPSADSNDKAKIIRSLCKPLSDVLMDQSESVAAGAALCLKILVESDNWRFASDEIVNEVCLMVSGAMEETAIQTNAHIGLVMALAKHNPFVLEAYCRSLIRSGLRILDKSNPETNSQRRFSAIQMINFLIKCVDSRSIFPELDFVVDSMEKLNEDPLLFIRGASFEALETAKQVMAQERSRSMEAPETPFSGRILGFASPESRTVNSFLPSSPQSSISQFRRSGRRLWTDDNDGVDVSLKDGIFSETVSTVDKLVKIQPPMEETDEQSKDFCGFVLESQGRDDPNGDLIHPQGPRLPFPLKNMNMFTTPRRLIRSLQDLNESQSDPEVRDSKSSHQENARIPSTHDNECEYDDHMVEYSESVSSCGETPEEVDEENEGFEDVPTRGGALFRLSFTLVTGLLSVMATFSLLVNQINTDGNNHGIVPT